MYRLVGYLDKHDSFAQLPALAFHPSPMVQGGPLLPEGYCVGWARLNSVNPRLVHVLVVMTQRLQIRVHVLPEWKGIAGQTLKERNIQFAITPSTPAPYETGGGTKRALLALIPLPVGGSNLEGSALVRAAQDHLDSPFVHLFVRKTRTYAQYMDVRCKMSTPSPHEAEVLNLLQLTLDPLQSEESQEQNPFIHSPWGPDRVLRPLPEAITREARRNRRKPIATE